MAEVTLDYVREVCCALSDEVLQQNYEAAKGAGRYAPLLKQLLEERRQVAELRQMYTREVLEDMTNEELEEVLWFRLLNRFPPLAVKAILVDIFEIERDRGFEP